MHELSIALSILDFVEEEAERRGGLITAIHLKLGPLSGVIGSALASAYDLAREGTPLEGTSLVIEDVPVVVFCPACARERVPVSSYEMCCGTCGEPTPQVIRGRELEIVALEIQA